MVNSEITDYKSIVILSSPRTGSTLLAKCLEKKLGYKFFNEPVQDNKTLNEFLRWAQLKQKFILKEHTSLFIKSYPKQVLEDAFVIRITRNNILEQTLSNYVALLRNQFIYTNNVEDNIPFDEVRLIENYEYIKNHNHVTKNNNFKIDLDMVYESLEIDEEIDTIPTPKPLNYIELKIWAEHVLKDRL